MSGRGRLLTVWALTAPLLLAGCGGEPPEDPAGSPVGQTGAAGTPTPTATDPVEPGDTQDLPGEPFDLGPEAGAELAVVGVRADDVLHVRAGPGVQSDSVAQLEPTGTAVAAGQSRQLEDGSVWVQLENPSGWASLTYLAYPGGTHDVTAQLGEMPAGQDLVELAREVARQRVPDPEGVAQVTVVDGPHQGDLAEVTVDVLGLMDDSLLGERLHVFAVPGAGGHTVRTVEMTLLCARGTSDGLCV